MKKKSKTEYYIKAFSRLANKEGHTWNWAAFFWGEAWMAYRKMYAYIILAIISIGVFYTIISSLLLNPLLLQYNEKISFCTFLITLMITMIAVRVFYGYYGNALYYRVVKHRIKNGYHLLAKYQPTSIILVISGIEPLIGTPISILLLSATDWLMKNCSRISGNTEINDENIAAYLNSNRKHSILMIICNLLLCCITLLLLIVSLLSKHNT